MDKLEMAVSISHVMRMKFKKPFNDLLGIVWITICNSEKNWNPEKGRSLRSYMEMRCCFEIKEMLLRENGYKRISIGSGGCKQWTRPKLDSLDKIENKETSFSQDVNDSLSLNDFSVNQAEVAYLLSREYNIKEICNITSKSRESIKNTILQIEEILYEIKN